MTPETMLPEPRVRDLSRAELRSIIASGTPDELRALAAGIGRETLRRILLPPALPTQEQCGKLLAAIAAAADEGRLRKLRATVETWEFAAREPGTDLAVQRRIAEVSGSIDRRLREVRPTPPPPRVPET